MTKHQYYLQLRKDILEERMRCDTNNAMILASLALQAEFGDYQPEVSNLHVHAHFTKLNMLQTELSHSYFHSQPLLAP